MSESRNVGTESNGTKKEWNGRYWGKLAYLNYEPKKYTKRAVKTNPNQVAAYYTKKTYKEELKELLLLYIL